MRRRTFREHDRGGRAGRALMDPLKEGHAGVIKKMQQLNSELSVVMARTGAKKLSEIDSSVIRHRNF